MVSLPEFYRNKRVLVTGHTGFKGGWLIFWLHQLGARVCGYALKNSDELSLYNAVDGDALCESHIGDITDYGHLKEVFDAFAPEVVFHLAAQPIVREGYREPRKTYLTNVMGTVNLLECVRLGKSVKSLVNVTTDKVYENKEWEWGYRENEPLDGYDPYSNSKSCAELVTHSYKNSFLDGAGIAVSTARAGNVIGGGDSAADRIIPDCIRAAAAGEDIVVRNPYSVRPYQHVLEPLFAYLTIAAEQYEDVRKAGYYNVGPDECGCYRTGELVETFVRAWGDSVGWINRHDGGPHEANFLKLDCSKIKRTFGWRPHWSLKRAVEKTVEWEKCRLSGGDLRACMKKQIEEFLDV